MTTPRPFLRWDPVIEPAVVPRHAYTEGESLQRLVVRSGVDGPAAPGGLEVTIVAAGGLRRGDDRRAPDRWISPGATTASGTWRRPRPASSRPSCTACSTPRSARGSAAAVRAALAVALREAGTFLDTTVADLDEPRAARCRSPASRSTSRRRRRCRCTPTPEELPRGEPPTPGQYVAHDVDELVVPYLPDPLAAGVSLIFPDAGKDHRLTGLLAVEGTTLRYPGDWPEPRPYRLVLAAGDELGAVVDGTELRITRAARRAAARCACRRASTAPRSICSGCGARCRRCCAQLDILAEAAADGWFWWLTPSVEMTPGARGAQAGRGAAADDPGARSAPTSTPR